MNYLESAALGAVVGIGFSTLWAILISLWSIERELKKMNMQRDLK